MNRRKFNIIQQNLSREDNFLEILKSQLRFKKINERRTSKVNPIMLLDVVEG